MAASEIAQLAAMWWCDQIFVDGKIDQRITMRDGLDFKSEIFEAFLNSMMPPALTPTDREEYETALALEIDAALAQRRRDGYTGALIIDVDYHPSQILTNAADKAGLKMRLLHWPLKTTMWIDHNRIEVRHGYGAHLERIV